MEARPNFVFSVMEKA